jgi:hypothetical protein
MLRTVRACAAAKLPIFDAPTSPPMLWLSLNHFSLFSAGLPPAQSAMPQKLQVQLRSDERTHDAPIPRQSRATSAPGLGLTRATSAPGLGLTRAASAPGLGLTPNTSAPGLGLTAATSAPGPAGGDRSASDRGRYSQAVVKRSAVIDTVEPTRTSDTRAARSHAVVVQLRPDERPSDLVRAPKAKHSARTGVPDPSPGGAACCMVCGICRTLHVVCCLVYVRKVETARGGSYCNSTRTRTKPRIPPSSSCFRARCRS